MLPIRGMHVMGQAQDPAIVEQGQRATLLIGCLPGPSHGFNSKSLMPALTRRNSSSNSADVEYTVPRGATTGLRVARLTRGSVVIPCGTQKPIVSEYRTTSIGSSVRELMSFRKARTFIRFMGN
jgi:hypothetical protein